MGMIRLCLKVVLFIVLFLCLLFGGFVLWCHFFPLGGGLLLRGLQSLGTSYGLSIESTGVEGNPIKGYRFENCSIKNEKEELLLKARLLGVTPSLRGLFQGKSPLGKVVMDRWFLHIDKVRALFPSPSSGSVPWILIPQALSLDRGNLVLASRDYTLTHVLAEQEQHNPALHIKALQGVLVSVPVDFQGILQGHKKGLAFKEGALFLGVSQDIQPGGKAHLRLSGPLYPETNLSCSFRELPLEKLGQASFFENLTGLLRTLQGDLTGDLSVQGGLRKKYATSMDLAIDNLLFGGVGFPPFTVQGITTPQGGFDVECLGESPEAGRIEGHLYSSGETPREVRISLEGTSLDMALGHSLNSDLSSLQGEVPSFEASYVQQGETRWGKAEFSGVHGMYEDTSFDGFFGRASLSQDKVEASFGGTLEALPLKGEGTLLLKGNTPERVNLSFGSPGMPLHRLKDLVPSLKPLELEGNMAFQGALKGALPQCMGTMKLRSDKIRFKGELLKNLQASLSWEQDVLHIKNFGFFWQDVAVSGGGNLKDLGKENLLDMAVTAKPKGTAWIAHMLPRKVQKKVFFVSGGSLGIALKGPARDFRGSFEGTIPSAQTPAGFLGKGRFKGTFTPDEGKLLSCSFPLEKGAIELKGTVPFGSGEISLFGNFRDISLKPLERSLGMPLKGLWQGETHMVGTLKKPKLFFTFTSPATTLQKFRLREVALQGEWTPQRLLLNRGKSSFWDGEITLEGTVLNLDAEPKIDLKGTLKDLDLFNSQGIIADGGVYLKGLVGGTFTLTGPGANPSLALECTSDMLHVNGYALKKVQASVEASKEKISLEPFQARIGSGIVQARGHFLPQTMRGGFSADSKALQVEELARQWELLSPDHPFFPRGSLDFSLEGSIKDAKLKARGALHSHEINAGKTRVENIHVPFTMNAQSLVIDKGTASLYGGTLKGKTALDFSQKPAVWKGHFSGKEIELSPFLQSIYPLNGDISGSGAFDVTVKGPLNYIFMTSGEGTLHITEGAFRGFPQMRPLLAKSKLEELAFSTVYVFFSVDGRTLYFMPGSRLTAPPGHPIYRYFGADGFLPFNNKPLNIKCHTEVNASAISAFLSAFAGFLETAFITSNVGDLVSNATSAVQNALLGGIFDGFTQKRDFREVSFTVKGPANKPTMGDLRISRKRETPVAPIAPGEGNLSREEEKPDVQITLSFPVGKGKKESSDVQEQLTQQLLEEALKQILPKDD